METAAALQSEITPEILSEAAKFLDNLVLVFDGKIYHTVRTGAFWLSRKP